MLYILEYSLWENTTNFCGVFFNLRRRNKKRGQPPVVALGTILSGENLKQKRRITTEIKSR